MAEVGPPVILSLGVAGYLSVLGHSPALLIFTPRCALRWAGASTASIQRESLSRSRSMSASTARGRLLAGALSMAAFYPGSLVRRSSCRRRLRPLPGQVSPLPEERPFVWPAWRTVGTIRAVTRTAQNCSVSGRFFSVNEPGPRPQLHSQGATGRLVARSPLLERFA